ncbi:ferric-dicitrate binding protein FerR, regulates iron transport through sigma-19 [Pedobacter terrae]|uniref:Ferric-dicitrate binding protein FerR, regulates iron transport through sigma-19 n=2 Tax=Pedobacter terrae TaxID=405671 RepID=A0A1G7VDJ7_9SPHI|nr:ferric-dicitrate binding protein FerR, regulates iron transport through sigma-19 [Pedobacter terrae]
MEYLADPANADSEFHGVMEKAWAEQKSETDHSLTAVQGLAEIWNKVEERKPQIRSSFSLLKYAAAIVVIISAALGWYTFKNAQQPIPIDVAFLSKTTQKGEKVKLILPDSSVVYLGTGSKLTWPSHFAKGKLRSIRLEGEAFFEVKHDTKSPFIVHSGQMQTRVLGTSFNIYAYPKDGTFSVAVRTGKVGVSENRDGKLKHLSLLTPGMKLLYHLKAHDYTVSNERITEVNAWIKNSFAFKDIALPNIFKSLERYYNVHFELKTNKLNQCRFNATFTNKSISDVMEEIRVMSGKKIKYKIDTANKTITVWGEGCQ